MARVRPSKKLVAALRGDLAALAKANAISTVTLRQFDANYPPPVRDFRANDIRRLRDRLRLSQPVFARVLHTTPSTVRRWRWEQGNTRPAGPALRLLNIIADKGLEAVL
jgi:putative transcriptional regulator